jgi:protein TonB
MDYASTQRNAKKHIIGFTGVVLLHVFIVYALLTGLANKTLKVLVKPLETKIIDEYIPPPPPPPPPPKKVEPTPPKSEATPPPYVPPPEVVVSSPTTPVISSVSIAPPVSEPVIAPPAPPAPVAVVAPPAPPKPKIRSGVTPTHKEDCTYPREALRKGQAGGDFMTLLNVDEKGNVTNVEVTEGRRTDGFERELKRCLINWKFEADGGTYQVRAPFEFKLTE